MILYPLDHLEVLYIHLILELCLLLQLIQYHLEVLDNLLVGFPDDLVVLEDLYLYLVLYFLDILEEHFVVLYIL
jgi:hypothetical protein